MGISATKLRQDLYNILDKIIEEGIPVEIDRKGHKLKIIPEKRKSKLELLKKHDVINGDPRDILNINWADTWQGDNIK